MTNMGIEMLHVGTTGMAYVLKNSDDAKNFNLIYPRVDIPTGLWPVVAVEYEKQDGCVAIDFLTGVHALACIEKHRSTDGALHSANKVRTSQGLEPLSAEAFVAELKESTKSMEDYLAIANDERRANGEPEYTMGEFIASRKGPVVQNTAPTTSDNQGYEFRFALEAMSYGARVARHGWNGKDMFVESVSGAEAKLNNGCTVALEAFFVLRSPNGRYNTWVPSVSDLMAHDWYEL